ncbi:hypothetical protein GCM10008012_66860 [Rhizobium anhuiense]|nr:hypothetical protein GCM10008012_66860 [Rhizobium anhuiense]
MIPVPNGVKVWLATGYTDMRRGFPGRSLMDTADRLPDDLASAHAMILAERAARREAEAVAARAQAVNSHSDALIARLRLEIEKLRRDIHGSHSDRKSERYAREGIDLSLSTLADQVGACTAVLKSLHGLIETHVLAAERLHGDDTTAPILAKGKTDTGRIWTDVRDDRPFGGTSPPAALYYVSRDRRQEHPERHPKTFTGILQADAYGGYNPLFKAERHCGPLTQALCWSHSRRKFFVLADIATNAKRGRTRRRSRRWRSRP